VHVNLDPNRLWTVDETAFYLGIPKTTLYRWRRIGIGPAPGRVGKYLRYDPAEVAAWFRKQQDAA
jgi:predicted DNA-binding transcriptional regulator AlpA